VEKEERRSLEWKMFNEVENVNKDTGARKKAKGQVNKKWIILNKKMECKKLIKTKNDWKGERKLLWVFSFVLSSGM
jgi:hypothetical protein